MRRALVVVVALVVLAGCAGAPAEPFPTRLDGTFSLYTHCGIHELTYDGGWYVRQGGRLDDGSGNPPDGWDNPTQAGTLTVTGDEAVFTDVEGHEEHFDLRHGADKPLQLCS
ncbi:hypothetical protein [Cellulomonas sp.]|uniref:hypothetical protein n=1 Tax=Cellulomonas sp. TaxID=40001 RepID=UPI003BA8D3EA